MMFLTILVASLAVASAQITLPGKCNTTIGVQEEFSVANYTGLWYEIYRYEQFQQLGGDCVTATYTLENGTVQVLNRMVLGGNVIQIRGTVSVAPDANGGGKLEVVFPSVNATSPYWVLKTDYSSYSLVYVCADLSNNRKRVSSWILSRTNTLNPQAAVDMNQKLLDTEGLAWETYRQTNQTESACRVKDPATTTASSF